MANDSEGGIDADLRTARAGLVLSLRSIGLTDRALLAAFESVPHEVFVPPDFSEHAYKDVSLPIACGQSISSPLLVARMLHFLQPAGVGKVLEIGTGTGYASMLLSRLARRVFTMERYDALARAAEARWAKLDVSNIVGFHEDGMGGLPQHAPFDRIILTASVTEVPERLIEQLGEGGVLVAAVGAANERQNVTKLIKENGQITRSEHGFVRLAPLTAGRSRAL